MRGSKHIVAVGLLTLCGMVGLFGARPWVLDRLELSLLDLRFRLRGEIPPATAVVLVAIDERSVDEIGRWPWRRDVMARLVDRLTDAGVTAIGFDVVFSEPEIPPETEILRALREEAVSDGGDGKRLVERIDEAMARADTDGRLVRAIERSERSVLGYFFRTDAHDANPEPAALERDLARIRKSRVAVTRLPAEGTAPLLSCSGLEANLERFSAAARRMGFFSSLRDGDGVVRRAPLVASCGGEIHVSLPVALAEVQLGRRAMVLGGPEGVRAVAIGELEASTDEGGRILVDFRGGAGTFPHYAAADVLAGRVGADALEGRIALIGATEVGIGDLVPTPFGAVFPGVEVHANVLDNLLSGSVLRRHDGLVFLELGALLVLGLGIVGITPRLRSLARGALCASGMLGLWLAATFYAFVAEGLWVNVTYPGLTLLAVYMSVALTQGITVEARARTVRRQFATYVPREVVEEMIERPERFRLGTERRDLSILFSDIRGFTTIAEEIGASDVSRLLNAYLTPVTRLVFESRGTLDKYVGDAVVAFWGAPLPVDDHPARACAAALAMLRTVEELRQARSDLPAADRLRVGIGLHSGEVVVGNMGSELRFAYTVAGDGVNLCSRLEGLTKVYGVGVLASADLVGRLPEGFVCREIDEVRVQGRRQSARIFEVLAGPADPARDWSWTRGFAAGLEAYRRGGWPEAERLLRDVAAARGGADPPSEVLLQRIPRLASDPPEGWDGIWTFAEK